MKLVIGRRGPILDRLSNMFPWQLPQNGWNTSTYLLQWFLARMFAKPLRCHWAFAAVRNTNVLSDRIRVRVSFRTGRGPVLTKPPLARRRQAENCYIKHVAMAGLKLS